MSQPGHQPRFSKMFMITLSIGFFLSAATMFLLWVWIAFNSNSSPAPLEYLGTTLRYQSFIWGSMALIQGAFIRQHTTSGWLSILVWCIWTILCWLAFWLILFVAGLSTDPVTGLNLYFPHLFFGGLIGMSICQWLGAMLLNQRTLWMPWQWWGAHLGVIGGIFLLQYSFMLLEPFLPESFWSHLLVVLILSLFYGLCIGFASKDLVPVDRLRVSASADYPA
ncbi:MAG: hypothetical protein GFH27_549311n33 [Chloroflexi bacterium AL-W]|nr:hypothetical protein [Chloroflexi bacterium AL-N1]NOK68789.1 hypothetical protein [Chloroflexi bacterium AL-N10]NOK76275.1 hypothetical protein [Chloroflexi bacterium AL-N5]NOK84088.1 hypothetical protein [Chloroflexi bacterium AL-W]NOK91413.1 hypothetical protein [Chloroflexi bacterium AL-N15]